MIKPIVSCPLPPAIFLMGPTAAGKTKLVMALSKRLPVEIISVDSALIYRGMNIGTAKPNIEELLQTPHRLIDIRNPEEYYSVANFRFDAINEMTNITATNHIPLLVGGTMFYFKVLLEGLSPSLPQGNTAIRSRIKHEAQTKGWKILYQYLQQIDPSAAQLIHPNDQHRIARALEIFYISGTSLTDLTTISNTTTTRLSYQVYQFALAPYDRVILHKRIEQRFHQMLAAGFEQEVQRLFMRNDLTRDMPSLRSVGYRQMWSYLAGEINYHDMVFRGICATRQLAKRQMTWLRRWRSNINWLDSNAPLSATLDQILQVIRHMT